MLDLCAGELGWSKAFAAKGWECLCVDLNKPRELPAGCEFWKWDITQLCPDWIRMKEFDFICGSTPCQGFAVFGMRHFHPSPKYPKEAIRLFNHAREICELSAIPYVLENVGPAQIFVGPAVDRCGSFYLWGNAVPPLLPGGITKGATQMRRDGRFRRRAGVDERMYRSKVIRASELATIPPELANCVADYAERLLESRVARIAEAL